MFLLDLAMHEMPQSLKPDDVIGAESLSKRPIEGDVSCGDCRVREPKN